MNKKDIQFARGGFFKDLRNFLKRRKDAKKQRTFCWCPLCNEDLCSNDSFISDTDLVRYECSNCGCRSAWNFDSIAPMLIRHDEIVYNKTI